MAGSGVLGSVSVARPVVGATYAASPRRTRSASCRQPPRASSTLTLVKHTSRGFDRSIVARITSSRARATVSFDAAGGTATLSATADVQGRSTLSQTDGGALPEQRDDPGVAAAGERVQLRPSAWSDLTRITATTRTRSGRVRARRGSRAPRRPAPCTSARCALPRAGDRQARACPTAARREPRRDARRVRRAPGRTRAHARQQRRQERRRNARCANCTRRAGAAPPWRCA